MNEFRRVSLRNLAIIIYIIKRLFGQYKNKKQKL